MMLKFLLALKRFLYELLADLLFPVMLFHIAWRMMKNPEYKKRVGEWFGRYFYTLNNTIWIHAVSGGEVITIQPMVEQLLKDYPHRPILITTTTITGAKQVERLFANRVHHAFLSIDLQFSVKTFLAAMQPRAAIFVETEIWPTLLCACEKNGINTFLINARLSEKSFKRYRLVKWLIEEALQSFKHIAVQTEVEAERFHQLGVRYQQMTVTGSLKFDVMREDRLFTDAAALREQLGRDRFVWCAASTHPGEEKMVLAAHELVLKHIPSALLILVPKRPDRFKEVQVLVERSFRMVSRRQHELPAHHTEVYFGDTLGELVLLYAASDVAFVGGSLVPHGGHNLLEPASVNCPIISGRYLQNFHVISQLLTAAKGLILVDDAASLADALLSLQANPQGARAQAQRAHRVYAANRGALQKQYAILRQYL